VVQGRSPPSLHSSKEGSKRRMVGHEVQDNRGRMGLIMEDWDADWKIPSTETEQPEMQQPEIEEIPRGEEEEGKGNDKGKIVHTQGIRGKISTKENQCHRERRGRL
jgi:hypothetical protein